MLEVSYVAEISCCDSFFIMTSYCGKTIEMLHEGTLIILNSEGKNVCGRDTLLQNGK